MVEERDGRVLRAEQRGLRGVAGLHEHLVGVDADGLEERDEEHRLVVAVPLAAGEQLLGAVGEPPLAGDVVHVADVVGDELEDGLELLVARLLAGGELGGLAADLVVGLGEALDGGLVPLAEVAPAREGGADHHRERLAQLGGERLVGDAGRVVPGVGGHDAPVLLRAGGVDRLATGPPVVEHVDGERRGLGRVDHHLVEEDGVGVGRADVVDEPERRLAPQADRAAGPRPHRDLDDVAGLQLGPADVGLAAPRALLFRLQDGAVLLVDAGEEQLGLVALAGHALEAVLLGARLDDDLARVVHELRDALVGVVGDDAHPVELAVDDGALLRRALARLLEEELGLDEVRLVRLGLAAGGLGVPQSRGGPPAVGDLGLEHGVAGLEIAGASEALRGEGGRLGRRLARARLVGGDGNAGLGEAAEGARPVGRHLGGEVEHLARPRVAAGVEQGPPDEEQGVDVGLIREALGGGLLHRPGALAAEGVDVSIAARVAHDLGESARHAEVDVGLRARLGRTARRAR